MSEPWMPTMYTPSLTGTEDFPSEGDWLIPFIEKYVRLEGKKTTIKLDDYQKWLLRHWLEVYPDGHKRAGQLRFRQVCTSLARQNGKSVLGLCMVVYFLLRKDVRIISLASQVKQAEIIYDMVKYAIQQEPGFLKRYKATGTRGVRPKKDRHGSYDVYAGNGDSLQGESAGFVMFDELHISKQEAYDAMLDGISAQPDAMILGITTAGDDDSALLKRLYETGKATVRGDDDADERFGFFLWEAPAHLDIYDPEAILAANPSLASGAERIDLEAEIQKMKQKPEHHSRRYRLNQFVSSENIWMPLHKWETCKGEGIDKSKPIVEVIFGVDKTPSWEWVSISAAVRRDGKVETELICQVPHTNIDDVEKLCVDLDRQFTGAKFYMDSNNLRDLSNRLRDMGIETEYLTSNQMMNATATVYSMVHDKRIIHAGDEAIVRQLPKTNTENVLEGHKVSRKKSDGDIDAVVSTMLAVYGAELLVESAPMLYVPS